MRTEHETSRGTITAAPMTPALSSKSAAIAIGWARSNKCPQNGRLPILENTHNRRVLRDTARRTPRQQSQSAAHEDFDRTQPSSTPPTRTAILSGNGDTSELVIGGTAARPCSDEVCMSIVRRLFDSVAARFLSNCWRSAFQVDSQQKGFGVKARRVWAGAKRVIHTLFGLGLAYLRVDDPVCAECFGSGNRGTAAGRRLRTTAPTQLPPAISQTGLVDSRDNRAMVATCLVCGHPKPRLPLVLLRERDRNLNTINNQPVRA